MQNIEANIIKRVILNGISTVVLGSIILLTLNSCEKEDAEALKYYNNLKQINNEIVFQIYKSLHETKMLILSEPVPEEGIDNRDYNTLKQSYDSITSICDRSLESLISLGPLRDDSILYTTYLQSLKLINEINQTEFNTVLQCMKNGELNDCRISALYDASMKIANNHVQRLDSIIKFNERYELQIDTIELNQSKFKAQKFKADIIRIHNSKCIWGNCLDGYGQQQDRSGSMYTGEFLNGLFHGAGKLILPNGEIYIGEFKKGSFEGKGKYTWSNGKSFDGEWRNNQINGVGNMFSPAGDSIFGYWENGVLSEI